MASAQEWERLMGALVERAASLAPYKIFRQGGKFVVKNNAGQVKATFETRAEALKYLRALYANVPGAPRKADRTKWTGTAPVPKGAS
jgi:hypothetical protein